MSCQLEALPVELIGQIADLLALDDFRHFRLASTRLGHSTLGQLALPSFKGLPWRDDAVRLAALVEIPQCARRIRSLDFNRARLDEREAYKLSGVHPEQKKLHSDWRMYYEHQRANKHTPRLDLDLVLPALSRLPSLESVSLSWTECPWEMREVDDIFNPESSVRLAKREIVKTTQAVLIELRKHKTRLKSLSLEPLFLPRLMLPPPLDPQTLSVTGSLTELSLVLKDEDDAFPQHKLDQFLSVMPRLKTLNIHWLISEHGHDSVECLPETTFPELEVLQLACTSYRLPTFMCFLDRHAQTLRRLQLMSQESTPSDSEVTWDLAFQYMQGKLDKLESISLRGRFVDWLKGSVMFYHSEEHFGGGALYDEIPWAMDSHDLEEYILKGGEYPQPNWAMM